MSHAAEDAIDHDVLAISSNVPSINVSKIPESNLGSDVSVDACELEVEAVRLISNNEHSTTNFPSSPCHDGASNQQKGESSTKDTGFEGNGSIRGSLKSGIARMESRTRNKQEQQQSYGRNKQQHHPFTQQGVPHLAQGIQAQVVSQGMNQSQSGMHVHPKFSSVEVQPSFHSPALNPPLYASAAACMTAGTPFYPNFQPSGLYSPQYSMGGYALGSTFLPPFMTGYPSHGAIPMPFGASSGPSIDGPTAGASAGENIPHVGPGLQHLGKFYGQHGLMLQPSFMDPLNMQYFQHPFGDAFSATVQHNRLASSSTAGGQIESFVPQKEAAITAFMGDYKLQPPSNGSLSIPSPGKAGNAGGSYYGGPPSMGVLTQFPASPLASPVLPSSPVGRINHLGRRNDTRFSQGLNRNTGLYSGGQGQRGVNSIDEPKRHYFLEELKSNNARKFELSDIAGRIVEFRWILQFFSCISMM